MYFYVFPTRFECDFFSTRPECVFTNFPLDSSIFSAEFEDCSAVSSLIGRVEDDFEHCMVRHEAAIALGGKNTLETSGEDVKLHSKRVEKM